MSVHKHIKDMLSEEREKEIVDLLIKRTGSFSEAMKAECKCNVWLSTAAAVAEMARAGRPVAEIATAMRATHWFAMRLLQEEAAGMLAEMALGPRDEMEHN